MLFRVDFLCAIFQFKNHFNSFDFVKSSVGIFRYNIFGAHRMSVIRARHINLHRNLYNFTHLRHNYKTNTSIYWFLSNFLKYFEIFDDSSITIHILMRSLIFHLELKLSTAVQNFTFSLINNQFFLNFEYIFKSFSHALLWI